MKVDEFFQKYRKEKNISQSKLGEMLGVTIYTISRIETGRQKIISDKILTKFASILSQDEIDMIENPDEQLQKLKELATGFVNNTKKASNIGEFLVMYRACHSLTQQDLAKLLDTSLITIARLETGLQAVLSPKMVAKIAGIVSEDELAMLDSSNSEERKVIMYLNRPDPHSRNYMITKHRQKKSWICGIQPCVDTLLASICFEKNDQIRLLCVTNTLYSCRQNSKQWIVAFAAGDFDEEISKNVIDVKEYFSRIVGGLAVSNTSNTTINKISLVIPVSYDEVIESLNTLCFADFLPFDISILHCDDDGVITQETYLRFNKEGRGVFDLKVDDTAVRAQAGIDFATWTESIGTIKYIK